jgi:hypothetical protein
MGSFFEEVSAKNLSKFACQVPKPLNPLLANTSTWHVNYVQSAILKTDRKKPRQSPRLSLFGGKENATPLFIGI